MKKLMMAAMVAAAAFAASADEWGFTYQAELRGERGERLDAGIKTVEIRLWDAPTGGDKCLWGRAYNVETDTNGLFNVAISDDAGSVVAEWTGVTAQTLADVFKSKAAGGVYVGLTVTNPESAGEIVPRQRIYAVPFAGTANAARSLVGTKVTVAGELDLGGGTTLSTGGLKLGSDSSSTLGKLTADGVVTANGGIKTGDISFSGTLKNGDNTEVVPVPVGGIIMWTKSNEAPDGKAWNGCVSQDKKWAICDGNKDTGTPDLRGRFIVGVGSMTDRNGTSASYEYGVGSNSGEISHKLATSEMPAHTHDTTESLFYEDPTSYYEGVYRGSKDLYSTKQITTKSAGGDASGNTVAHENRPPYYALYFIMRIK